MSYKSEFTRLFLKLLDKLDEKSRELVLNAIDEVLNDPRNGSQRVFERQALFMWWDCAVSNMRIVYEIYYRLSFMCDFVCKSAKEHCSGRFALSLSSRSL